jgi:mediator of RNA polymerase II transcription subunit 14
VKRAWKCVCAYSMACRAIAARWKVARSCRRSRFRSFRRKDFQFQEKEHILGGEAFDRATYPGVRTWCARCACGSVLLRSCSVQACHSRGLELRFRVSGFKMQGLPRHTQTVKLGELVERVVCSAHDDLVHLASGASGRAETDRKRELARYLHTLRQRLTRLHVLAEWAPVQRRARIAILCGDMVGQLKQHDRAFADTADRLFGLHQQMGWARAPLFDLPGALDVLCNGKYSALHSASIAEVAPIPGKGEDETETAFELEQRLALEQRLDCEMRSMLLDEKVKGTLPEGVLVWGVKGGTAIVGVPGEYRATLGLGGPPPLPKPVAPGDELGAENPEPEFETQTPPHGGWLVRRIELLAGARDIDEPSGTPPRPFTITKLENRVLGERATARMAGMSPPAPAPPELVENGAEGICGLHRVGRDAALRLVAATIAEQTKRVALKGGAWFGGAIRVEPIKGRKDASLASTAGDFATQKNNGHGHGSQVEKTHGKGEGIRVWFWLPGASRTLGASGTRLAGVDVGSVEVARGAAAANDAAVAAGSAPRIELLYEKGEDAVDARIVARALVPAEGGMDTTVSCTKECAVEKIPFDMSSVDVREALADGIRFASLCKLRNVLDKIQGPCEESGLFMALDPNATRPIGDSQTTAGNKSAEPNEDGWGEQARPAIVVRLTENGTCAQVCCDKKSGGLVVVGVHRIASSAYAAALAKTVKQGGIGSLPAALTGLVRAALESDLRRAMRTKGLAPVPSPRVLFRVSPGTAWPFDGEPPCAAAPVCPSSGGLFVAVFVTKSASTNAKTNTGDPKNEEPSTSGLRARLALIRARRVTAGSVPGPATWLSLTPEGRDFVSGDSTDTCEFTVTDLDSVASAMAFAAKTAAVAAQRLAVSDWLEQRNVAFSEFRPIGAGGDLGKPTIAWNAFVDDNQKQLVQIELVLAGEHGVTLTVTGLPRRAASRSEKTARNFSEETDSDSGRPAAPGCAGVAEWTNSGDGNFSSLKIVYPGEKTSGDGAVEFGVGAACADAHRVVSTRAFVWRVENQLPKKSESASLSVESVEALSCVVACGGRIVRVGWVGPSGPTGGLAAVGLDGLDDEKKETAVSEAARVGDVRALAEALATK